MTSYGIYLENGTYLQGRLPDDSNKQKMIENSLVFGTLSGVVEAETAYPLSEKSKMSDFLYLNSTPLFELLREGMIDLENRETFGKKKNELYSKLKIENEDLVVKVNAVLGIDSKVTSSVTPGTFIKDKLIVYGEYVDIYRFMNAVFPVIP